jgi:hypothetical protein
VDPFSTTHISPADAEELEKLRAEHWDYEIGKDFETGVWTAVRRSEAGEHFTAEFTLAALGRRLAPPRSGDEAAPPVQGDTL